MAGKSRVRDSSKYSTHTLGTSIEVAQNGSSYYPSFQTSDQVPILDFGLYTEDVVGNRGGDNPFLSVRENQVPMTYAGVSERIWMQEEAGSGGPELIERKERTTVFGASSIPWPTYELQESDVSFITRAYADTNPSAADFDAPVFIGELRDIPSLLKNASQKLSKAGANEYLKYQYGWKPLYSDIRKLMRVMSRIEKRLQTLRLLQNKHVIKRSYTPPDGIEAFQVNGLVSDIPVTNAAWIAPQIEARIETHRWAKTTWIADPPQGLPSTNADLMKTAFRAAYGGTIDGSTLWELMPWSWLIDWNTNMSEYLESQRNIVGASPGPSCLMKQTTYQISAIPTRNNVDVPDEVNYNVSGYPGSVIGTKKERILGIEPAAISTGEINLLGGSLFKQSILGALAMQRLRSLPF